MEKVLLLSSSFEQLALPDIIWQLPVAAILVFVVLKFLSHMERSETLHNNTIKEMNQTNVLSIKEMHKETLEFIARESETNRLFLKTQREHMNDALGRLAEEIKSTHVSNVTEQIKVSGELTALRSIIEARIRNE